MAINDLNKNTRLSSSEFKPLMLDDEEDIQTQDIDTRIKDQEFKPQYIDVDKPKFVQPEQRSYYVAGNVANNEIHTTAQRPNEIEYEADVVDDEKKKDNYFGLSKLATNKKDIVKNALKCVMQAPNLIQNAANSIGIITGKSGEDVALEGVRGFAGSTVDFASAMTRFFGQNYMYFKAYKDEQLDKITNLGNVVAGGEDFSDDIKQKYTDFYNRIDRQTQEFKDKTERFLQYTGIGKTDKDGFIYDLVGGGASWMYAIGITAITKSPAAAAEFFGMYQYQSFYEEGIEKGFSPLKARAIGVVGGAAEGALEMVGLHMLLETLVARKSFMKLLKAVATEFVQEASQQGAEELLAKFSGMREEGLLNILQNVGYAGLIGALIGGGSTAISNTRFVRKMISDSATKELINIGVKDEYAKRMVNNMLNFSVSPQVADELNSILKDEQSPVTYKNADPRETYKEFGDTVKKALDPAQKRGIELELIQANKKLTQELANVLLNSGKAKNSDEAYRMAEQQTAMYDVLAREAYNQENIKPAEYYKRFHVNAQSGQIELDERNIDEDNAVMDDSFEPVDFDEQARAEYEAAMDAEQEYMDQVEKENKTTLKKEARILGDIGIGAIRRPTADGYGKERWSEYNDLSPRIKNYFFTDTETAMSWDEAEDILANSGNSIKDLFEYLAAVDNRAVTLDQPAYHGTPHRFDTFSTDKIGTGEGAQAHGWGLYFAENKDIAEKYRKNLIYPIISEEERYGIGTQIKIGNRIYKKRAFHTYENEEHEVADIEKRWLNDILNWIEVKNGNKENILKGMVKDEFIRKSDHEEIKKFITNNNFEIIKPKSKTGQVYKVDIPDNDTLLDEDKTFQKQPERVKKALSKLLPIKSFEELKNKIDYNGVPVALFGQKQMDIQEIYEKYIENPEKYAEYFYGQEDGRTLYQRLSDYYKGDRQASLKLNEAGIKGITYDGQQDGRGYVIFDDKAVKILEKFYQVNTLTDKEIETAKRFNRFLQKEAIEIQPHESLTKKDAEDFFRQQTPVKHNELGNTTLSIETVDKILRHKGFNTSTIIRLLPELYKTSNLIDSPTERQYTKTKHKQHNNIAFWHNTLNKFKIDKDNYIIRFTVAERKVGQNKKKGTIGERYLHSSFISGIDIEKIKDDSSMNIRTTLSRELPSDNIVADYFRIVNKFNRLNQDQEDNPRGAITSFDRQYWIDLFSGSDKSTLLHEGSHGWLSEVLYFAQGKNPSPKILAIKKQLDNWLGEPEDNGRYSKRQQELFAGASEVYFMEGKAPTPKLKTVFERFKKWLTDIYDAIRNDLPKINDDVRELFDTILSRSYDVPDSNIYAGKEKAIKEVIKNIQEGRASEVDGITIDDVYNLLNVAYTRKPSKPSTNLKQLLNDKNIYDFNELTKAGADTVLQILKDGGYIKEDATAEAAVELAKAALDGNPVYRLADQWRVAGDIDFARNLRVLEKVIEFSQIDSAMEKILTLQEEGYRNVEQGDVEQVKDEYKRLMSADVKEAKKIVEDIINRLHKKRFIDRAAQKQMIVDLNFSSTVEEIKESVLNVIEELQDEIKLVKEQLRNPRKPIVRKDKTIPPGKNATEEEKNNYKKYMRKQINRLLKQALPRKQNQQKFSKFDVQTQKFFTDIEKYNKMTIEQAQEELYNRATSIIDDEGVGLDNFEKMKNRFLSYKANKINQNSAEFYKQLYDNLQEINVFGRNAKDIENTLKKEQIQQDINSLVVNIEDNKSKNKVATGVKKQYIKWLGNWWSTINAIAGKKQADKDSLEKIEIDIFNKNYETTENLKTKCAAALGLKNVTDLDMTVNAYLNTEYTYQEKDARSNTENAVKLNKMQLICCYIWMKNSTLRERIVRAFGNVQIMDMMDKLTIQDKKFGDELQQSVADMYDEVNAVYLKMYGLDMPQAENYFPSSVERIQGNMDLLKDNIGQVSSPGFIKARVQSNLPLMNFGNPVKIALDHIAKVNHFIYMQEKLADLNKVYKTTVVKRLITNAYGDRVYAYILQVLDNAKFTNVARTIDGISDIGDYLVNNYVLTKIAVKPSIMMKQLLSCINYAEDMSAVKWFEGFLKGVASPKKVIDFMMKNSKYCQSRFAKGGQSEALLKAMEGSNATFAKVKTFKGMLSWMTRVGDIGAIMFGGYPYVMDQMSKGVPLKTAIENFERATIRSQQASLPSTLSNFQYRGMNSWLYRAMFAFANTPNQYSRKIGDTMYMYFHGDINKKQFAKNLILYGVLNSFLYTSFTSLAILTGLVSGDWDDLKDDVIMSLFQTSNILALPLISQAYNSFVSKVVTGDFLPDKEIPLLDDMVKIMRTATKDELEFKDWLTIVDEVASLVLGVPVKTLYNTFVGSTKDLLDGEYGKFAVKLYGATESRANKIFD